MPRGVYFRTETYKENLRKTYLKKLGRIGLINREANKKIAEMWKDRNIRYCELHINGCLKGVFLSNCHRHSRVWYRGRPELLSDFKQVIRGCVQCHQQIDSDRKLKEEKFNELRGKE